jgi:transcriptional regulator with XRE-family HTH domain
MTQQEVASKLGTHQKNVSGWEQDRNLETRTLEKLLTLYKATLSDLAELVDASASSEPGGGSDKLREIIADEVREQLRRSRRDADGRKSELGGELLRLA